jgi:hypothetical protein
MMCYSIAVTRTARAGVEQSPTVFPDPSSVQSTGIGQSITVNINVSNVADLYAWQAGVRFDPSILECTGFYQGEFLRENNGTTFWVQSVQDMNNTLGIVYIRGCSLLGQVSGVSGSGQLAYVTFRSVGVGVSDFHLTDVILLNSSIEEIPFEGLESVTVLVNGTNFAVKIADNLTGELNPVNPPSSGLFNTGFNAEDKDVSFDAVTTKDWYCRVSIPMKLLRSPSLSNWTVRVDGTPASYTGTENETYTTIYIKYNRGNHTVQISPLVSPYWCPADVNHDLKVDILDVVTIASAYGSTPSSPNWNPHADIAPPYGKIDIPDVVLCISHYGEKYH